MSKITTATEPTQLAQDQATRKVLSGQQRAVADLLERRGSGFVSLDSASPVEILFATSSGTCRFTVGLVFQPLLHQLSSLLTYGFCQLGLDALIFVVPDLASLERLAYLLRDQTPAEWGSKVGVVTATALNPLLGDLNSIPSPPRHEDC